MDAQSFPVVIFADSLMKDHEDKVKQCLVSTGTQNYSLNKNPIKIYEEKAETEDQNNTVVFNPVEILTP